MGYPPKSLNGFFPSCAHRLSVLPPCPTRRRNFLHTWCQGNIQTNFSFALTRGEVTMYLLGSSLSYDSCDSLKVSCDCYLLSVWDKVIPAMHIYHFSRRTSFQDRTLTCQGLECRRNWSLEEAEKKVHLLKMLYVKSFKKWLNLPRT